ncbi:MAG: hypothetical protein WC902_10515, partial [Bacteroidales bacterium]
MAQPIGGVLSGCQYHMVFFAIFATGGWVICRLFPDENITTYKKSANETERYSYLRHKTAEKALQEETAS